MRENELIRGLRARVHDPEGMLGIGDDCCTWTPGGPTCLSTDTVVEGRHFLSGTPPGLVGRKAAAAALSDLAAMAARPVGAVCAITVAAGWDAAAVMEGLITELERHGCPLLGGDTTAGDRLTITMTVWGERAAARFLTRSGGQFGDLLAVTGPLGGSLASGRHLRPEPRFDMAHWLADQPAVHALMDLSDGLAMDAPRLAAASSCGCLLLPAEVPVHPDVPDMSDTVRAACCDGEDFELLLAVDAAAWPDLQVRWPFPTALARVGMLLPQLGAFCEDRHGQVVPMPWTGYEHRV